VLAAGTHAQALGDPKQGLSKELDAVAAYLTTLDHVNPSPFRNTDGSLTPDGAAGKALFSKLGCDFCHSGKDFTDSARGRLHDVGTLKPSSGTRGGMPLLGLDTPSLLGVWETAPYLHDGSAATLRDVLTSQNTNDQHGFTSALTPEQLDQLVAYLQQIDGDQKLRRLPFEPTLPETGGAAGAANNTGAGTGTGAQTTMPTAGTGGAPGVGAAGGMGAVGGPTSKHESSCAFGAANSRGSASWLLVLPLLVWYRKRRRLTLAGGAA